MNFSDYLRILKQRGWIILVLAVLTGIVAFGFSAMQPDVHKSTLNMLVRPARNDFGQSQAAKVLLDSYKVWMESSYRAERVIEELQLDMTPQALLGDVEVASDSLSLMLTLAVENSDPNLANDIARVWGEQLIQWQQEQNDQNQQSERITIEFRDNPQAGLVEGGNSQRTKINAVAGFVFGGLMGVLVILLLEWLQSGTVRRSEDIERYLEIPVVGNIPQS